MLALTLLALPLLSTASSVHGRHDSHSHTHAKRLPSHWFHEARHPVHELFRRDDATFPTVGSDAWAAGYPPGPPAAPDVSKLPAAWVAALNDAVSRKAIPDIPLSLNASDGGNPTYPNGLDPNGPEICSATYKCRIDGDIWDGPAGTVGISFDDGPEAGTDDLLAFLESNKQKVTHFLIGSNILYEPAKFTRMFKNGDDLAVHTWTHPHMTTQSNLQVVAELGYTMQIIHQSTGGRVPKYWRPPYGDSDKRVTAIAKEVFGLTTVVWNQDTLDWSLTDTNPETSADKIQSQMKEWLGGPKTPGLVILEHEVSQKSVASFVAAYPLMQQSGWQIASLASLLSNNVSYQNAADNTGTVNVVDIVAAKNAAVAKPDASSSAPASSPSKSSVASVNNNNKANTSPSPSPSPSAPSSASPQKTLGSATAMLCAAVVFLLWQ
ncbi:carbohydrate esterase family 4 protein [Favolaschia claudopus]|uniref:chitin deacetylase n=1 Tax=Favolaschia claudopus TaxID=2862362 RepID=A0AAW0CKJ6_9AGAR